MSQMERPASLKRMPKPAPDNNVDPIDTTPDSAPEPPAPVRPTETKLPSSQEDASIGRIVSHAPAAPARRGGGREVTVPISTRVAPDVVELLDAAVAREGITFRAAVEMAVRGTWGV